MRVKLSANVAQTGPNSFSENEDHLIKSLKIKDPNNFDFIKHKWGNYPVQSIKVKFMGKQLFTAWVGLNDPEGGFTLLFNLVYPETEGHPNKEDIDLWDNFIMKTKQLSERDFFKANGQDMQTGYTIVTVCGEKLKMTAEKRQKDGKMQVVVIPITPNVNLNMPIWRNVYSVLNGNRVNL